jgi:hypothetical protein
VCGFSMLLIYFPITVRLFQSPPRTLSTFWISYASSMRQRCGEAKANLRILLDEEKAIPVD